MKILRRAPLAALLHVLRQEVVPTKRRSHEAMQKPAKSIFILNSALTTKLSLELAYRDPRCPLQRTSDRKHPILEQRRN